MLARNCCARRAAHHRCCSDKQDAGAVMRHIQSDRRTLLMAGVQSCRLGRTDEMRFWLPADPPTSNMLQREHKVNKNLACLIKQKISYHFIAFFHQRGILRALSYHNIAEILHQKQKASRKDAETQRDRKEELFYSFALSMRLGDFACAFRL
jgi:hypothetical protein